MAAFIYVYHFNGDSGDGRSYLSLHSKVQRYLKTHHPMAPNKTAGKAAAKAAKKAKQADKAAKKEATAIKAASKSSKGKGKVLEDEDEDLDAILERYQAEMRAVSLHTTWILPTAEIRYPLSL